MLLTGIARRSNVMRVCPECHARFADKEQRDQLACDAELVPTESKESSARVRLRCRLPVTDKRIEFMGIQV